MSTSATADDEDVDPQIHRLLAPSGDPQYRRVRGEALEWLLAHADAAYPKILAIVEAPSPPSLAIAALPRFRRADSVPVIERLLHTADDMTVVVATQALAEHASPEARAALERALHDARDQVVASAADALAQRGDPAACLPLSAALAHPNPDVRARVQEASDRLGCKPARPARPGP